MKLESHDETLKNLQFFGTEIMKIKGIKCKIFIGLKFKTIKWPFPAFIPIEI
jgi:hypothetical protein